MWFGALFVPCMLAGGAETPPSVHFQASALVLFLLVGGRVVRYAVGTS
jgi:hypothetical protein